MDDLVDAIEIVQFGGKEKIEINELDNVTFHL